MRLCTAAFATITLIAGTAAHAATPDIPVQLYSPDELDACTYGAVTNVGDDESAMIFAGPTSEYDVIDYVANGDMVWICDGDEGMAGIIYPTSEDEDCGALATPYTEMTAYEGPCASGWIMSDLVEVLAG